MAWRRLFIAIACSLFAARSAEAQAMLEAHLHRVPAPINPIDAEGMAHFELSADQKDLHYTIEFTGLDLEPDPAKRVDVNDVFGVHLHLIVPGVIGPHILNIFGMPGEDDADAVFDYDNETITGRFDLSDASRDPATGELYPQFFPLTTKIIDDWVDELVANKLYLAVHTVGENTGPLLHGDVLLVPEPGMAAGLLVAGAAALSRKRRGRGNN